jgi:hypothetical protein
MPTHLRRVIAYGVGITMITLTGVVAVHAARRVAQWPEHLSALAINMGDIGRARPGIVDMFVVRWSTREERHRLVDAFVAGGPDELFEELMSTPEVGYLRTPDNRAYNIYLAWDEPTSNGGRRIVLAAARPLKFWEAATPRSNTDGFTLIEIRLNPDGRGEGKMSITTKVAVSEELDLIELENYANEPARLIFTP